MTLRQSVLSVGAISWRINFKHKLHRSTWLQQSHRKVFPSHPFLLAKPNRTFGLSSFSTWMCCMSWCVKKGIDYLDQKTTRCQSLCRLSLLIRERCVADRAKPLLINIKQPRRAQTSPTQPTKKPNCLSSQMMWDDKFTNIVFQKRSGKLIHFNLQTTSINVATTIPP